MKNILIITIVLLFGFSTKAQQTGTMKDHRDGQTYKWVKIGNQVWMAENLNYKTHKSEKIDNDYNGNYNKGQIYNGFDAVKACPSGWRIPTYTDWTTLIEHLGGDKLAGGKLKATDLWQEPNKGATNSSGFRALPASYYDFYEKSNSKLKKTKIYAHFWSSYSFRNSNTGEEALMRFQLNWSNSIITEFPADKRNKYSIRCIED